MESDLKTSLTVSSIRNNQVGKIKVDYVTSVKSNTTMEKENELFFQVSFVNNLNKKMSL